MTLLGLERTIYSTRGEHANHYTIDVVICNKDFQIGICYFSAKREALRRKSKG
jgi:hypothetical protein